MFKINNRPILSNELSVILELQSQLHQRQIPLLNIVKDIGKNIQITCPKHNNGQERKPSCGIIKDDKKTGRAITTEAGTVHCFTCNYTAKLEEFISYCFGFDDDGRHGKTWLVNNFVMVAKESRPSIDLGFNTKESKVEYVTEKELDSYRYYHDYMYKRKLTDNIIELFDVGYDKETKCITFPVKDIKGNVLFIARRSVTSKFFNYPADAQKPVYGLYEIKQANYTGEIIVCESVIDALTCWVYDKYAVALNGTGTNYQYEQLKKMSNRKVICGFDGDLAGRKAIIRLKEKLKNLKIITEYNIPDGKDINDLTKKEFDNLMEFF